MTRRILAALLALAPKEFRLRYGDELLLVHEERARRRGRIRPGWMFSAREILGVAWAVLRMRVALSAPGSGEKRRTKGGAASMIETTRQDARFAFRALRRNPGFAAAAVTVVALGIGANTAIFTAVNAFFFRPLPFTDADRLVMLYETNPEFGWTDAQAAPANALDWREQVAAFHDVALYSDFVDEVTYVRDGEPTLLRMANVSGNFFDVLGARPSLGGGFRWEDTWQGNDRRVVLSHSAWVSIFGADPGIVGRTEEIAGTPVEISGVMPKGFQFPSDEVQLWSPLGWDPANQEAVWFRRAHFIRPVARLAPGVSLDAADAQLQAVVRRLQQDYPETNSVMGAGFLPLRDFLVKDVKRPLYVLLGAVALLLLLACTNVANLMLVRASDRTREVALRYALGASRPRVARQMITESLVVALGGGLIGLGVGWLGVRSMATLTNLGIDGATDVVLDVRVLVFTAAVAVACGIVFGTVPALGLRGGDLRAALKEGGRGRTEGRQGMRMVRSLVAVEVALALLLVVGAGLMVRSFWHLYQVDPGFRPEGVLGVKLAVPSARYHGRADVLAFWDRFQEALEARPGIERAGLVGHLPLAGTSWSSQFQAEGWPPDRVGIEILHRRADRGYFEALEIPLVRGRLFERTDGPDDPLVVVINEAFASEHFPGEDPIGQRIAYDRMATPESTWYEIVGIVGDQQQVSPRLPARAEVFENRNQDWAREAWVVVRTSGEPLSSLGTVREALRELDPLIPVARVRPLREVWRASLAQEELILALLGVFGLVALLLASVGVYGVTAQAARRRTQEMGIRMALGAAGRDVLRLMLRQGLGVVGVGLAVGLLASLAATRVLTSFLFGVAPTDPGTLVAVAGLLAGSAASACYLPARRAAAEDPLKSLRAE